MPSVAEISQLAVSHLETADNPIVSFGQGCEGEPLLQAETIDKAIKRIRSKTPVCLTMSSDLRWLDWTACGSVLIPLKKNIMRPISDPKTILFLM